MNKYENVSAIVVTYNPEVVILQQLLNALDEQLDSIVVVDNGSGEYLQKFIKSRKKYNEYLICLGRNLGIAAAHNVGIDWARRKSKTHVILFDQDSIPSRDMVLRLMSKILEMGNRGIKVAAVGPYYQDERNIDRPSFISISGLKVVKSICQPEDQIIESDMLISSGSLIPISVLEKVGGPLNELFIDQIDIEWCCRVKSKGYRLFVVCDAYMRHSLGESPKIFLGQKFLHHSPLRHYYIFRNAVWLLLRNYVPLGWKLFFIRKIIIRFIVYCIFISPRLDYFKMMTKGIWHGLRGRLGQLETNKL